MSEKKASETSRHNSASQHRQAIDPAFSKLFTQVPQRLHNFLQSNFKRLKKVKHGKDLEGFDSKMEQKCSIDWKANLEKQLQIWRENPAWGDQPPEINVSVPKGSLCNLHVKCDVGLPPDAVYNIVTDPDNKRVFKNIKEVISRKMLIDEGMRQVVELEQAAIWRFLWWSGTISVHVLVDQNRTDHSMKFKQVTPGFMKNFEGCWSVDPVFVDREVCGPLKPNTLLEYDKCTRGRGRVGSRVRLEQLIEPAVVPPPPISWYLRGITTKTTEMLIVDLIAEANRVKGHGLGQDQDRGSVHGHGQGQGGFGNGANLSEEKRLFGEELCEEVKGDDIKERWALHRRNSLHSRRRLRL